MFGRIAAPIRVPEGGGLTEPSITDVPYGDTWESNVMEHLTGKEESPPEHEDELGWGHQYGYPGTGVEDPPPDAQTVEETKRVYDEYEGASNYGKTTPVRNVAGLGRHLSWYLDGTMAPLFLAGADPFRKRVTLTLAPGAASPAYVGTSASILAQVGASQSILFPGVPMRIEHMDDVYVIVPDTVLPNAPIPLSVEIERYER